MNRNRISIYDYPEHLNPFFEGDSLAGQTEDDNDNEELDKRKAGTAAGKYGTWGAGARHNIRRSILESKWIDALNLSPAKNKVTKKLYSFKTKTIDKFQRQRSKSNAFEHFLHKPEKREANTQKTVFGNRILASSTPLKRDSNVWETSKVNYAKYKEDSSSPVYDFQGAKPKLRKKRSAPMPPGAPLDPDTEKVEHFNESDVHENGLGRSNENNEIYPIPGAQTNSEVEEVSTIRENQSSSLSLKPVETKENITI